MAIAAAISEKSSTSTSTAPGSGSGSAGMAAASTPAPDPKSLRILTLNCWGLKFLSTHRRARLLEIGHQLASATPQPSIVGLQECWTQEDFLAIHSLTKHILPYAKFFFSGIFGGGLAILSAYPIEETGMHPYPLNGRPQAFFRGDWYVGKGVGSARIRVAPGRGKKGVVEVFVTHLHAPYERPKEERGRGKGDDGGDSYLCHRTAQAWFISGLMRGAAERGHGVIALGDFNMLPLSLAYRLIEGHSPCRDVWRGVHEGSALGPPVGDERVPMAEECIAVHGATCDSALNTWRWSAALRKDLERGLRPTIDPATTGDSKAKRLDYVFFSPPSSSDGDAGTEGTWEVESVEVGMMARHPQLGCSLSDHFSVETTLRWIDGGQRRRREAMVTYLPVETYDEILALIDAYESREKKQRQWVLALFPLSIVVSLGCFVAVWFSPRNFVAFILTLVSTLGLSGGVLCGLIGGLFVNSELRTLEEFRQEIRLARAQAHAEQRLPKSNDLNDSNMI